MNLEYQKQLNGKKVGVVFGSFSPLHQGHLDLIMRAKKQCDGGCIVIVCGYSGDKGEPLMPLSKRYRYVREFFADDDFVSVYAINDDELGIAKYPNGWTEWLNEANRIWRIAVKDHSSNRVWYVGDEEYYIGLVERQENAVLINRFNNAISGSKIRENPFKYWNYIAKPFKRLFSYNVLICGTASEGKSTLAKDLGKYFNAPHSYEYAREYMEQNNVAEWEFDEADYIAFLYGQYNLNKSLIDSSANNGMFFADTDSMVTKMYAEYYTTDKNLNMTDTMFKNIALVADTITKKCRWDKIYLLSPKGVFVDDHSRYMGHSDISQRQDMFKLLCKNLKESGNWNKVTILNGGYWNNFEAIVSDIRRIRFEKD